MTQFDTRYQTQAGATVDRDRIALLEVQRESRELTIATLEADLAQLRKDFDQYRAQNPSPAPRRAAR
jgi:hypothetical protein